MTRTIVEAAESHFRSTSNTDTDPRLTKVRADNKTRERALRIAQKKTRLEQRAAAKRPL